MSRHVSGMGSEDHCRNLGPVACHEAERARLRTAIECRIHQEVVSLTHCGGPNRFHLSVCCRVVLMDYQTHTFGNDLAIDDNQSAKRRGTRHRQCSPGDLNRPIQKAFVRIPIELWLEVVHSFGRLKVVEGLCVAIGSIQRNFSGS